jgi:hypothetical protein
VSSPEIQSGTLWTLDVRLPTRLVYLAGVDNFWKKKKKKTNNNNKITSRDKRKRVDALCVYSPRWSIFLNIFRRACSFKNDRCTVLCLRKRCLFKKKKKKLNKTLTKKKYYYLKKKRILSIFSLLLFLTGVTIPSDHPWLLGHLIHLHQWLDIAIYQSHSIHIYMPIGIPSFIFLSLACLPT